MNTWNSNNVVTIQVADSVVVGQAVNFAGGIANSEKVLGICMADIEKDDFAPVKVIGSVLALAGGTIAKGDKLVSDSAGRMIKHTSEDFYEGYAMTDAAEGNLFEMVRGI